MRTHLTSWSARGLTVALAGAALGVAIGVPAGAAPSVTAKQGGQLVKASFAHAGKALAVAITGSGTSDKESIGLNVTVERNGEAAGTITVQGQVMHVVKIGSVGYLKADAAFWQQNGGTGGTGAASLFADRWIKASGSNSPLTSLNQFLGFHSLFNSFPASKFHWLSARSTTFHGQAAYAVRGTEGGQTGTVVVSTGHSSYPLEIKAPGFVIDLKDWNQVTTIRAPHGAIDLDKLGG